LFKASDIALLILAFKTRKLRATTGNGTFETCYIGVSNTKPKQFSEAQADWENLIYYECGLEEV
jgi:hypothetical protein